MQTLNCVFASLLIMVLLITVDWNPQTKPSLLNSAERRQEEDVRLFVSQCIHCHWKSQGVTVRSPFGPSMFGTMQNDLIQFDYIDLGFNCTGKRYILMVKDDQSGYSWFYPTHTTDATSATNAPLDWSVAFGPTSGLMSDGPSHFRNEAVRVLANGLKTPHHFIIPYCP